MEPKYPSKGFDEIQRKCGIDALVHFQEGGQKYGYGFTGRRDKRVMSSVAAVYIHSGIMVLTDWGSTFRM
jgi:hypothetical protein